MKQNLAWMALFGALTIDPAQAQQRSVVDTSLAGALSAFVASDPDGDQRLTFEELQRSPRAVTRADFDAHDLDGDSSWSRDEFVLNYRQFVLADGKQPAADLASEAARLQALRRVKDQRGKDQVGAQRAGVVANRADTGTDARMSLQGADADLEAKLQRALNELEKKAAARNATRADFAAVRDAYEARAKAVQGDEAQKKVQSDLSAKFARAMDQLEQQHAAGKWNAEEFTALKTQYVVRARGVGQDKEAPSGDTVEARFERALADLEARAAERKATPEDWSRVKGMLQARARASVGGGTPQADEQAAVLAKKLEATLDRLQAAAKNGAVSREQFAELRTSFVTRARGVVKDAGGPPAAGAEGIEARFERALVDLETRAAARQATPEDWSRVKGLVRERARASLAANGAPVKEEQVQALAQKLDGALVRLENAAKNGAVTREQFSELRQSFITRARGADGEKGTGDQPPARREPPKPERERKVGGETPPQPNPVPPPSEREKPPREREKPTERPDGQRPKD